MSERFNIRARIEAGPSAVPESIELIRTNEKIVKRLFAPILVKAKLLGLPQDLRKIVELVESTGLCVDDLTFSDVMAIAVALRLKSIEETFERRFAYAIDAVKPLTERAADVLLAMIELNATPNFPKTKDQIEECVLGKELCRDVIPNFSRTWKMLRGYGYVDSRSSLGVWLTLEGHDRAERVDAELEL